MFQIKEQDIEQEGDSFAAEIKINQKILFLQRKPCNRTSFHDQKIMPSKRKGVTCNHRELLFFLIPIPCLLCTSIRLLSDVRYA